MAYRLVRTQKSEDDLLNIWSYIAVDSPKAADRFLIQPIEHMERTLDFPKFGKALPQISVQHRGIVLGNYLLIYHLDEAARLITLVRVVHGARDWEALFEG